MTILHNKAHIDPAQKPQRETNNVVTDVRVLCEFRLINPRGASIVVLTMSNDLVQQRHFVWRKKRTRELMPDVRRVRFR